MSSAACRWLPAAAIWLGTIGWQAAAEPVAPESWTPTSTTAQSVTGQVQFAAGSMAFQYGNPLALADPSLSPAFSDGGEKVQATIYRVAQPEALVLRNGNPLCGQRGAARPVTYVAVWKPEALPGDKAPRAMAAFSGAVRPEATGGTAGCGVYFYDAGR